MVNFWIFTNSPYIWFWKHMMISSAKSRKSYIGWIRKNLGIYPSYHFGDFSSKNGKGYARLSPDFSMDFVRLIYFVVFLMLNKMQKNFFGKSTFLTCVETIFRSTIFDKIFFPKLSFFVFKSFRMSHLTMRGHFLALQYSFSSFA